MITHGAIGADALVYQALVSSGDQVVSVVPTYQQHYSIPESLGADVRKLALRPENDYLPDLAELRELVSSKTRLIAFTNPNNPTGSLLDPAHLEDIIAIADSVGAYILSDEVYRGTAQHHAGLTPSITDLYARGISVGSMSKAFSLAGIRLGWICGPSEVLKQVCACNYSNFHVYGLAYALEESAPPNAVPRDEKKMRNTTLPWV